MAELEALGLAPGTLVLQGGRHTNTESAFVQDAHFLWAFGAVHEPGCMGVLGLSSGDDFLLIPRAAAERAETFAAAASCAVKHADELAATLNANSPGWLHVVEGEGYATTQLPPLGPGLDFCFEDESFTLPYEILTRLMAEKR